MTSKTPSRQEIPATGSTVCSKRTPDERDSPRFRAGSLAYLVRGVNRHFCYQLVVADPGAHSPHESESPHPCCQQPNQGALARRPLDDSSSFPLRQEHAGQTHGPGELVCGAGVRNRNQYEKQHIRSHVHHGNLVAAAYVVGHGSEAQAEPGSIFGWGYDVSVDDRSFLSSIFTNTHRELRSPTRSTPGLPPTRSR